MADMEADVIAGVQQVNQFFASWHAATGTDRERIALEFADRMSRAEACFRMDHDHRLADLQAELDDKRTRVVLHAAQAAAATAIETAQMLRQSAMALPANPEAQKMLAAAQLQATLAVAYATLATR